jgi:hypothetical protein
MDVQNNGWRRSLLHIPREIKPKSTQYCGPDDSHPDDASVTVRSRWKPIERFLPDILFRLALAKLRYQTSRGHYVGRRDICDSAPWILGWEVAALEQFETHLRWAPSLDGRASF